MMTVYIGADHRGFGLKNELVKYLRSKKITVKDAGNQKYDSEDDFPVFASKVSKEVQKKPKDRGIVICGSGVGVSISANKFKDIRCVLGFNEDQVKSAVEHNHVNILALGADYIDFNKAKKLTEVFLITPKNMRKKYRRRIKMISSLFSHHSLPSIGVTKPRTSQRSRVADHHQN